MKPALAAILLLLLAGAAARAEDQAQLGLRYAETQAAGLDQLKQYRWHTDTTLAHAGEVKVHFDVACRLDEKGAMVQEVETAETSVRRKHGLRGRAQAGHAEEVGEFLDKVMALASSYIFMSKGQEVDFFDRATLADGTGPDAGRLVVQAADVSVKGDTVTKIIDPERLQAVRITFATVVDEVPVTGEVLYRPIEDGPNVPRMLTIEIPSQEGVVKTEFLDYRKQL